MGTLVLMPSPEADDSFSKALEELIQEMRAANPSRVILTYMTEETDGKAQLVVRVAGGTPLEYLGLAALTQGAVQEMVT